MKTVLSIALLFAAASMVGCGSGGTSSVIDGADQAAIDAYEAQIAEDDKALQGYSEKDLDKKPKKGAK